MKCFGFLATLCKINDGRMGARMNGCKIKIATNVKYSAVNNSKGKFMCWSGNGLAKLQVT